MCIRDSVSGALFFSVYLGAIEVGEVFGINKSFLVLFMIIIGGLGSIFGSFAGAAFLVLLPVLLKNVLVTGFGLANRSSSPFRIYDCGLVNYSVPYSGAAWNCSIVASSKRKIKALALPSLGLN